MRRRAIRSMLNAMSRFILPLGLLFLASCSGAGAAQDTASPAPRHERPPVENRARPHANMRREHRKWQDELKTLREEMAAALKRIDELQQSITRARPSGDGSGM